ncbi:2OG-Fe(II) oxygenase family protein [Streptomyces avermitilis]|uniref:2OG-Fe(II) oxygenase family protein n=1 Tax=Streptomyces avermitilis TaxID=33903 RepID=UPI0033C1AB83
MALAVMDYGELFRPVGRNSLIESLREYGAVPINTSIPQELEGESITAAARLFALPDEEKMRHRGRTPLDAGYAPYGSARALDTGVANLLESWTVSADSPRSHPSHLIDEWYALTAFARHLRSLGENLLALIDQGWSAAGVMVRTMSPDVFPYQLFRYPRSLLGVDARARRQSIHRDSSIITLLPPATGSGLLIEHQGEFIAADTPPGCVTVMAGSLLEHLTAGGIRSCTHTVETPGDPEHGQDRLSSIYFVNARNGVSIPSVQRGGSVDRTVPTIDSDSHAEHYSRRVFGTQEPDCCENLPEGG